MTLLSILLCCSASANVIFSNSEEEIEKVFSPEFNYPIYHSKIRIINQDSFTFINDGSVFSLEPHKGNGVLNYKEPEVYMTSFSNREIYGQVKNKWSSPKLALTITKNKNTGLIEKIESKTIPLSDILFDWGGKFVRLVLSILQSPTIAPSPPAYEIEKVLSDEDKIKDSKQCIQWNKSLEIPIPTDLTKASKKIEVTGNNDKECIHVEFKAVPASAIPFDTLKGINVGNNLLSSICREAEVTIYQTDKRVYKSTLYVVDHNFLVKSQIPKEGVLIPEKCTWKVKK